MSRRGRQAGQRASHQRLLLTRHPPDHLVVAGVAVDVLDRELGLADTTRALQGVEDDRVVLFGEVFA